MILPVIGVVFAIGLAAGAGGMNRWNDAAVARAERARAVAQAKVAESNAEAKQAIENGIQNLDLGYQAGLADGKKQAGRVTTRVAQITSSGAFVNPACTATPEALRLYTAALGSVRGGKVPDELLTISAPSVPLVDKSPIPQGSPVDKSSNVQGPRPPPTNPLAKKP